MALNTNTKRLFTSANNLLDDDDKDFILITKHGILYKNKFYTKGGDETWVEKDQDLNEFLSKIGFEKQKSRENDDDDDDENDDDDEEDEVAKMNGILIIFIIVSIYFNSDI